MKSYHYSKYIVFLFTALFTFSAAFNAVAAPKKEAKPVSTEKLVKQAASAYDKGNFQEALDKFNQAYEAGNREDSALLYNIGRVYESMADYNSANTYYKQFIMAPGSDETARQDALERIKKNTETLDVLSSVAGDSAPAKSGKKSKKSADAKVAIAPGSCIDINTASEKELTGLPGIGASYAKGIVAGRPFQKPEDIKKVKGIGDSRYNKMAAMICPINGVGSNIAAPTPAAPVTKPAKVNEPKKQVKKDTGDTFDL